MSNRSFHFANRFQTMISAIRAAPLRVLFLAVAVAVCGLMTVTDLTPAAPVHAQEQAVTATRNATGESPPARPTDLQASAEPDSVSLTWTASTDQTVTHYAVLRRDRDKADAGVFEVIDGNAGSATSYTDGSVSPEGSYVYRVKAVSPTGVSQWSSYARADIPADPEDLAPSGLSAKAVFDGGDSAGVALAWDAPAADAASVTGYEILRAVGDGDLAILVADTGSADTTYTDDTATKAGESYAYRVKALRGEETSQPSDRAVAIIPSATARSVEPGIAEEQNVAVWSATLTPRAIGSDLGCFDETGIPCSNTANLSDNKFTYDSTDYSVYVMRQASRRSWRIGQTRPVKVVFMSYKNTLQADALKLVAKKLQSSLAVEGELPEDGLAAYGDDGDDLMMALARKIVSGDEEEDETVEAVFAQARDAEAASEEFLVDDGWKVVEVEPEAAPANGNGHHADGIGPTVELVLDTGHVSANGNGHAAVPVNGHHDEAPEPQQSLFSWAEFMAEEPVKPKGRGRKAQPASTSLFEWALNMEQEREEEPVGAGR